MSLVLFTQQECDKIKSYWNEDISLDGAGRASFIIDETNTVSFNRRVKGRYIDYTDSELINFIVPNLSKIGIKSITQGAVKISKYTEGDYFEPHHDFNFYGKGAIYKTLVVQLSDPNTYLGGELYVKGIPQTRVQGGFSLFLSSDIHEVKLIQKGERFSLVIFLYERDFENSKSII